MSIVVEWKFIVFVCLRMHVLESRQLLNPLILLFASEYTNKRYLIKIDSNFQQYYLNPYPANVENMVSS